jgi:integrase/recombinase XerD
MTPLRIRMKEELQRRNYSEMTAACYVRHVAEFAKFFRRSPDSLGADAREPTTLRNCRETPLRT